MKWIQFNPLLRPDQSEWLHKLSEKLGESMNSIIRKAIDYYRKNHE